MPPPGIAGGASLVGASTTIASVVISSPATDTAPCSAVRTTLVGSMTPALIMLTYSAFWASKPKLTSFWSSIRPATTAPSKPAFSAIWRSSACSARHDLDADLLVVVGAALALEHAAGVEHAAPATGDDALLDRGLGRMHGILDPVPALLDLDLGGAADLDDGSRQRLGRPLLQLLAVVVGLISSICALICATRASMSFFLPAPSMIVVLSLSIHPLGGAACRGDVLELDADISLISRPAVRIAVSSIDLRRSPKPGALTAATLSPPRSLLTTRVASASPSISAMMSSGRPDCATSSSRGSSVCRLASFCG